MVSHKRLPVAGGRNGSRGFADEPDLFMPCSPPVLLGRNQQRRACEGVDDVSGAGAPASTSSGRAGDTPLMSSGLETRSAARHHASTTNTSGRDLAAR